MEKCLDPFLPWTLGFVSVHTPPSRPRESTVCCLSISACLCHSLSLSVTHTHTLCVWVQLCVCVLLSHYPL